MLFHNEPSFTAISPDSSTRETAPLSEQKNSKIFTSSTDVKDRWGVRPKKTFFPVIVPRQAENPLIYDVDVKNRHYSFILLSLRAQCKLHESTKIGASIKVVSEPYTVNANRKFMKTSYLSIAPFVFGLIL